MGVSTESIVPMDRTNGDRVRKTPAGTIALWGKLTRSSTPVRAVDLATREIHQSYLKGARKTSSKPCITIKTFDVYQIDLSPDTLLLCEDSEGQCTWKAAGEFKVGDWLLCNGTPDERYKDRDWLKHAYQDEKLTQAEIADICGIAPRTVRAYVKKFNLNFRSAGAMFGEDNPRYNPNLESRAGGYARSWAMYREQGLLHGYCTLCGAKESDTCKLEVHHIDHNPLNVTPENVAELCQQCHKSMHLGYSVKKVRRSKITDIWGCGDKPTVEFKNAEGNVVVEGFIVRSEEK